MADEADDAQAAMAVALRDLKASLPTGQQWWALAKRYPTASAVVAGGVGVGLAALVWRVAHAPNGHTCQVVQSPERKRGAFGRLARRGAGHLQSLIVSTIVARLVGQNAAEEHVDDVAASGWPVEHQG